MLKDVTETKAIGNILEHQFETHCCRGSVFNNWKTGEKKNVIHWTGT
jgi:hypothetical protein